MRQALLWRFALAGVFVSPAQSRAQPVIAVPPRAISPGSSTDVNLEPAIVASPLNGNEVLIAWQRTVGEAALWAYYAVSVNGLQSVVGPTVLPDTTSPPFLCSMDSSGDVGVAASRVTGDLYLSALTYGEQDSMIVARKPLGYSHLVLTNLVQAVPCGMADKGFLAIGPRAALIPGSSPELAYVGFSAGAGELLRTARSMDVPLVGSAWATDVNAPGAPTPVLTEPHTPPNPPTARKGWGACPLVLGSNSSHPGRLILASSLNQGWSQPPELAGSDTGGGNFTGSGNQPSDWNIQLSPDRMFDHYSVGGLPRSIRGTADDDITHQVPLPGQVVPRTFPSMTSDPRSGMGDNVYVAFCGRDQDLADDLDIFVMHSTDAGLTGGPTFQSNQRFRLGDGILNLPGERGRAAEFLPSIAVDGLGGINLLFMRTGTLGYDPNAPPPLVTVRYARWPSINSLAAGDRPSFITDLSAPFGAWAGPNGYEYIMVTASGCDVYPVWAAQTSTGVWGVYAAHIVADVGCITNGPQR